MPALPGLESSAGAQPSNPFSGIRRAGQAKRANDMLKFQSKAVSPTAAPDGSKFQNLGAQAGTQVGSMRQMKFA